MNGPIEHEGEFAITPAVRHPACTKALAGIHCKKPATKRLYIKYSEDSIRPYADLCSVCGAWRYAELKLRLLREWGRLFMRTWDEKEEVWSAMTQVEPLDSHL